jgi:Ser-tRNA(Ala) deacylase AlaX
MHSAEHILNQTMVRLFDCGRAISAHIEKKKSKVDYRFDRNLTTDEITDIEERVNDIIQKDLPVRDEMIDQQTADRTFNLSRLPDEAGQTIRIVYIGDFDACPCSGEHVLSTAQIGIFKIISADYTDGRLRLRFRLQDADGTG